MEGKASDWRPGPTVCRCCLTEGCYKDISTEYFWMGKREVYAEMLTETLNVSIAYSQSGGPNSNSRLICEPCISRLRDASEFKRQVIDCEKTFMHYIDPGSSSKSREFAVGEVKVEVVKREKESLSDDDFDDRTDFIDDDTDDDLDDQPLTKLASKTPSKIPKKESDDILELLDNSQITVKRKSNLKLKTPPKKIVKKKLIIKPTASKVVPAKQAEKKKDDAWTTSDASVIKESSNSTAQCNEWITTDSKDDIKAQIKIECTNDYDEWDTTFSTEVVKIEVSEEVSEEVSLNDTKENVNVDEEWVVSDTTNMGRNQKIVSAQSSAQSVKEDPLKNEWTTTLIKNPSTNTKLKKQDCAPERKESKSIWVCIGQKMVKVVVDEEKLKTPDSNYDIAVPRNLPTKSKISGSTDLRYPKLNAVGGAAKVTTPLTGKKIIKQRDIYDYDDMRNARLILKHTTALPFKIQHKSIDVPCFACESQFEDPALFREHFFSEHKSFDKTKGMNSYTAVQTRVDITYLSCLICTQSFDTLDEVARHLFQEHKINIKLEDRLGLVPLKFPLTGEIVCVVCQKQCMSFRDLYRHSGVHFPIHVCEICGNNFESMNGLRAHLSIKHCEGNKCRQCGAVCSTVQRLQQHVRNGCTGMKCKICKISFSYSASYQKHRETVHGAPKRIYKCGECLQVFEKRMQLYFHKKKYHTEHYKCSTCSKRFHDSSGLRRHMLVHTGERPYQCHICHQGFKNRSYIKIHVAKCKK